MRRSWWRPIPAAWSACCGDLLDNARLHAAGREVEIEAGLEPDADGRDELVLSVADRGPGVPAPGAAAPVRAVPQVRSVSLISAAVDWGSPSPKSMPAFSEAPLPLRSGPVAACASSCGYL